MTNTWNGKTEGETGKGSGVRDGLDKEKFGENLDKIRSKEPTKQSCGACVHFKGFDVMGFTICNREVRRDINSKKDTGTCIEWEWLHGKLSN